MTINQPGSEIGMHVNRLEKYCVNGENEREANRIVDACNAASAIYSQSFVCLLFVGQQHMRSYCVSINVSLVPPRTRIIIMFFSLRFLDFIQLFRAVLLK